jgi:nucleoside-diphosphate-sugar epimerase
LAEPIPDEVFQGVRTVVHLAAETAGGQAAHELNSITATQNLVDGCARNDVRDLVNIGSVAVMVPSSVVGRPLDEQSPVDGDNLGRGPYVWGKAKAEALVAEATAAGKVNGKTVRLGPLVDFEDYTPPGRLGRELGNFFVAMGNPWDRLPICSVDTAADVIMHYVEEFESAPELLNLIQPDPPKRSELWRRQKNQRPELTAIWLFKPFLIAISATLKLVLRVLRRGKEPLDVYAAFASEQYDTTLSREVLGSLDLKRPAAMDKAA